MAIEETKLVDLQAQCLANKESRLSTTAPTSPKSFLVVESVTMAGALKSLEKRATQAQREVLAITAKEQGLSSIARMYGIPARIPATKFKAVCHATASTGNSVSAGAELTATATGAYYTIDSAASSSGTSVTFSITAADSGEAANLIAGQKLTFTSSTGRTAGVVDSVEVDTVTVVAEDKESLEDFRRRVVAEERRASGGGCTGDFRYWAEAVSGVARAYPYSGKPVSYSLTSIRIFFSATDNSINETAGAGEGSFVGGALGLINVGDMVSVQGSTYNNRCFTVVSVAAAKLIVAETVVTESAGDLVTIRNESQPGDVCVFVKSATLNVSGDPIPTVDLLANVRQGILYKPNGQSNWPVGEPETSLYIEPVSMVGFTTTLYGLDVDDALETDCKEAVVTALATYYSSREPYIEGLDFDFDRADLVTIVSVSEVVQGILEKFGASVESVALTVNGNYVTSWILGQGKLAKSTDVEWND